MRNPVGAALNAAQLLLRMPIDERTQKLAQIIQNSSFRMKGLIDNILDFARGRMGDGIVVAINKNEPILAIINQVIGELKLIYPDQEIETKFKLEETVDCDGVRIAQLFSNLLGNAITHGQKNEIITVDIKSLAGQFTLSITNKGNEIPQHTIKKLFNPFSRGQHQTGQEGLGLGLYISSEIAKAHTGDLTVTSNAEYNCFSLTIPNCLEMISL